MEYLRPMPKAKLVLLNLHLTEELTDKHSMRLTEYGIDSVLFWELSYNPKDMTFNQDKKVLLCVRGMSFSTWTAQCWPKRQN